MPRSLRFTEHVKRQESWSAAAVTAVFQLSDIFSRMKE
jgi:hypothetical protein